MKVRRQQIRNWWLVRRYPFLMPRDYRGECISHYKYEYTLLDDMPEGWRKSFGKELCKAIRRSLVKNKCLKNYQVLQIKEKYGELRWYDRNATEEIRNSIIPTYTLVSRLTCARCGGYATQISTGWISPWCGTCAREVNDNLMPIWDYYKE